MDNYHLAAERLQNSRRAIALTGAGISVESGIPDFRGPDGLWTRYDAMEFALIDAFRERPGKVWKMLLELLETVSRASPNPAHYALAELERRGLISLIITQNIDSLHQRAGSQNVIEYHGHTRTMRCDECEKKFQSENVSLDELPPRCGCGTALRPDIVFFGEEIPDDPLVNAYRAACDCDLMLIIGTSAMVVPAAYLPLRAKERGAYIIEINPSASELTGRLTDLYIPEPAGKALPAIVDLIGENKK